METYKSIIAYDGTDFHGFQRQREGLRTVQSELELALRSLGWQEKSITAAGRTDVGVHARGQVIAYPLGWKHEVERLTQALNAHLPSDIAVVHTEVAGQGFHPRFSARRRRYRYTLIAMPVRDPLRERFAWRIWPEPDLEVMAAVAQALVASHDFAAFGRAPIPNGTTVRRVFMAEWQRDGEVLTFDIEADAFLYRMVRRLVAAMVEVGSKRRTLPEILALLEDPSRRWQGPIAPAKGLCLDAVCYEM
jgi:tRNA pseudouridine38-40 synthase